MDEDNDIALGDVDGDGDLDVVIAKSYSTIGSANEVWLNLGGGFSPSTELWDGQYVWPRVGRCGRRR